MIDYFKETEFVLDDLRFDYLQERYRGRGILRWKPKEGFHLEAPLNLQNIRKNKQVQLGKIGIIRKSDTSSIRMSLGGNNNWAITPSVVLIDRDDVILQRRLSLNLNRVIFFQDYFTDVPDCYLISILYETKNVSCLFDRTIQEQSVKINECEISKSSNSTWNGINYKGEKGETIQGYLLDDKYLKVTARLPRDKFSKAYSWRLSEAIQYSLSILLGQKVSLLKRELRFSKKSRIEIRKANPITSLNLLSLFDNTGFLNKDYFIRLTELIAGNELGSDICCNIFQQLIDASNQRNWQVAELLLSTILEAALRNIDGQPFQAKKSKSKQWNVGKSLDNFIQNYLSNDWNNIKDSVMKSHTYLRDRNAHPDWLFTKGGALSEEEREKSLDSMIFLSRFYGYMILALAGFKDLKPDFPKPHSECSAPLKINFTSEDNLESVLNKFI